MRRLLWSAAVLGASLLAPIASLADDQSTAEEIASNLKSSLKNYKVDVKVQDGTAWLQGYVSNPKQMAAAEQIASKTDGVQHVVNNLTIGGPATAGQAPQSELRQPSAIAKNALGPNGAPETARFAGQPAPQGRFIPAAQAGAEPPQYAQQQRIMATDAAQMYNGYAAPAAYAEPIDPAAYNRGMPGRNPAMNPMYNQGSAGRPSQPMPLAMNAAGPSPYRKTANTGQIVDAPETIDAPQPMPYAGPGGPGAPGPYHYDHPSMPGYAWPSYAAYPNYAAVTYPKQYSPTAWPYIGPFYPYPQVPLGWRKVSLEWKDGWWFLDFKDSH